MKLIWKSALLPILLLLACVQGETVPMPTAFPNLDDGGDQRDVTFTESTSLPLEPEELSQELKSMVVEAEARVSEENIDAADSPEPVWVYIMGEEGRDGTDITQWFVENRIHFGYSLSEAKQPIYHAEVPVLRLVELAEVDGVSVIQQISRLPTIPMPTEPPGASIFTREGQCDSCHSLDNYSRWIYAWGTLGPPLDGIGSAAATRIPGMSAKEYLRESIVNPDAFLSSECSFSGDQPCPPGLMEPFIVEADFTDAEVDALVEFLLMLK